MLKSKTKIVLATALSVTTFINSYAQSSPIDLWNWRLELPTGYKASDWKLSNFQKDRFAKPFFHLDTADSAIVMEAYPAEGTSKAKYTRNTLREQMQAGSSDVNWTFRDGAILETEFKVTEMSTNPSGKQDRTIILQIDGRTTEEQTEDLGLKKPVSMPYLKVYWQKDRLYVKHRELKNEAMIGDDLLLKTSWKEDDGVYSQEKVGFEKVRLRIEVKKSKVKVYINDEKPIVYRGMSVSQWYFENYFTVGNYLQSKEEGARSVVRFYRLNVSHD
jgi:hypothetical protein